MLFYQCQNDLLINPSTSAVARFPSKKCRFRHCLRAAARANERRLEASSHTLFLYGTGHSEAVELPPSYLTVNRLGNILSGIIVIPF